MGVVWVPANQNTPLPTLIGRDTNRFITHSDGERAWIHALKTVLLKVDSSRKPVVTSNTANSTGGRWRWAWGSDYWQEVVVNGKGGNFWSSITSKGIFSKVSDAFRGRSLIKIEPFFSMKFFSYFFYLALFLFIFLLLYPFCL